MNSFPWKFLFVEHDKKIACVEFLSINLEKKIMKFMKIIFMMILCEITTFNAMASEKTFSPYVNDHTPAFAMLIVKNNKTIFKSVQGCAVLEKGQCQVKANFDTPFSICSITKQFTAAAILMLEEDGKLSTDDEISQYIPNLPPQFKGIKIKHLIFHISGVPNYLSNASNMDFNQMIKKGETLDENKAFENILKSTPEPYGKNAVYSNSGYVLLTKIIENVSGESYSEFMQKRIFNKLNMTDAFVMSDIKKHKNHTLAYSSWPLFTPIPWMTVIRLSGDGGIFMSINDFEKWVYAFSRHQIFTKEKTMKKFLSVGKLDNGYNVIMDKDFKYGFGLGHTEKIRNGKKYHIVFHTGGMPGTASLISNLYNNENNIWIAYLNNAGSYPDEFDILKQIKINY